MNYARQAMIRTNFSMDIRSENDKSIDKLLVVRFEPNSQMRFAGQKCLFCGGFSRKVWRSEVANLPSISEVADYCLNKHTF